MKNEASRRSGMKVRERQVRVVVKDGRVGGFA